MPIFSQFGEIVWQWLFNIARILQKTALNKLKIRSKYLIVCWQGACSSHIRKTDILKKSSVDCSRIAEKSWKRKILLEVKTRKQLQDFTALWNLLERYMANSCFSLSSTFFCQLQHFWGILWSYLPFARTHQFICHPNSCIVTLR